MEKSPAIKKRVLQVVWPGADWKSVLPMVDEGLLPNLRKLIDRGVIGKMTSVQPNNPASVWTSAATGKYPHDHGIVSEVEPAPGHDIPFKPVSCFSRATKAVWNVLHGHDLDSIVVGWPGTFPAEPVRGAVVAPNFTDLISNTDDGWVMLPEAVHPGDLAKTIAELRVHPREIGGLDLVAYVPKLAELEDAQDVRLTRLAEYVAESASLQAAMTELMETRDWDFASVYFGGLSNIGTQFVNYQAPQMPFVADEDFKLFQHVVRGGYIFHDMMLGRLVELAGKDATVLVVSDEGIHAGDQRSDELPDSQPEHIEPGLLVLAGPNIEEDKLIYGASILDILPTVLHVFGLPVGKDMSGRVLDEVFRSNTAVQTIESHDALKGDDGRHAISEYVDSPLDRFLALNRQVNLGSEPDFSRPDIVGVQTREFLYNMAESLMAARQEGEAIALLNYLADADPTASKFQYKLMTCYMAIEQPELALESFNQMLERKKQYAPQALKAWKRLEARDESTFSTQEMAWKVRLWKQSRVNLAGMAFLRALTLYANQDFENALHSANQADETKVYNPSALLRLRVDCLMKLERPEEAIPVCKKMLAINPDDFHADIALAKISYQLEQFGDAVTHAANAISKRYYNPLAHYIYGGAIFRCGKPEEAAQALTEAVAQDPFLIGAHQRLALLYKGILQSPDKARHHREQSKQMRYEKKMFLQRRKTGYGKTYLEVAD